MKTTLFLPMEMQNVLANMQLGLSGRDADLRLIPRLRMGLVQSAACGMIAA